MAAQDRYWQEFVDLKRDALYIGKYHASVESVDRWINVFQAVAASSSIGAWAIWKTHDMVWAGIIAASQVITAVKQYLPFKARLKGLSGLHPELEALAITAESDWFKVSSGQLDEAAIHSSVIALKKLKLQATNKNFPGASLPHKQKLLSAADIEATAYMERF